VEEGGNKSKNAEEERAEGRGNSWRVDEEIEKIGGMASSKKLKESRAK
jgi:transposase-like protein